MTEFPNVSRLNELMIVGPVTVRSACSHHLCPILGKVWIGLLPNEHSNLIGLSKYVRICDWIMSRPQIQEEAVTMLANELQDRVKPDGLAIVMEADHFCMHWRGVKDDHAMMTNSVMRGAFLKDANLRREFLSLLAKKVPERRSPREPTMLVRLMYASRAGESVNADALPAILKRSKEHNPTVGVTGVLCFCTNANIFLQVLEGGRNAVSALYNRDLAGPAPPRRRPAQLRGDRRAQLLALVDGPGQHEPAQSGAGAQVLRERRSSTRTRSRARRRWRCSTSWSRRRRSASRSSGPSAAP